LSWRASSGLRSWLLQRLSAVYIVLFLIIIALAWGGQPITYHAWRLWVAHPVANIALLLFVLALLLHAWIGGRDVVIDYIHSVAGRYVALIIFALGIIIMGLWSLRLLISVTAP
jgi:succinate dehydrogenase / fumarate reductase membrane anchor subunit